MLGGVSVNARDVGPDRDKRGLGRSLLVHCLPASECVLFKVKKTVVDVRDRGDTKVNRRTTWREASAVARSTGLVAGALSAVIAESERLLATRCLTPFQKPFLAVDLCM